jgi:hypothetical protein
MTKSRTPTEGQQLEAALKAMAMTISELNRGGYEQGDMPEALGEPEQEGSALVHIDADRKIIADSRFDVKGDGADDKT